jgi:hypothetical protein
MARLTLWTVPLLVALLLLSCGGDSSEPTPATATAATATSAPTTTADAQPGTATAVVPSGFQHLEGETMAFDYPADWNVWSSLFNGESERIVVANVPVQSETVELPAGGIKIAFESPGATGPTLSASEPLEIMYFGPEAIPFGLFEGGTGAVAQWSVMGTFDTGERVYYAFIEMNTEEPAWDALKPILETWTFK